MKVNLFKSAILIVAIVGLFYALKPEKVQACWDFNRDTGTWVVEGGKVYYNGSWWHSSCIGTQGYYDIESGEWYDW